MKKDITETCTGKGGSDRKVKALRLLVAYLVSRKDLQRGERWGE